MWSYHEYSIRKMRKMNSDPDKRRQKTRENLFSAISFGSAIVIIGMVFVLAQPNNLWDSILAFFNNITFRSLPYNIISLPAPANPGIHTVLYTAAFQFSIGIGVLQVILLALRLTLGSSIDKTAETLGNVVYWFGAAYIVTVFLSGTPNITEYFMFWAGILVMAGLSLVARGLVLLAKRM